MAIQTEFEDIAVSVDEVGVATLTLDRSRRHNALSGRMIGEIAAATEQFAAEPDVRVVVLAADGPSFCAGADLNWMQEQIQGSREQRLREASRLARMLHALHELDKPLIGRVQGHAFGGGIGLMCTCDIAIGVPDCRFGLTETRLGLVPATIGPYVAARLGVGNVRRALLSPGLLGSDGARDVGLLSRIVPESGLDDAVREEAERFLLAAPGALAAAKSLVRSLGPAIDESLIDRTVNVLVETWEGREAADGVAAFFRKEPPPWQP